MADRGTRAVESLPDRGMEEYKHPTIRQQLSAELARLEKRRSEVETAINLLDRNPQFEAMHDALSKLNVQGILR